MRLQIWMAAALVITVLGPPPGVVGQPQMKEKVVKDKFPTFTLTLAPEKKTTESLDLDRAELSVLKQKLSAGLPAIPSSADRNPNHTTIEYGDRPVVFRAGRLPADLPSWFAQLDTDRDGQVGLYEWRESGWPIAEFHRLDRNGDGFLTIEEVLSAMTQAQAHGLPDEVLVRRLPADFRTMADDSLRLLKLGEVKLTDNLPKELKPRKADQADGPLQGLKPRKADQADAPPIKDKGQKPGKPTKDGGYESEP